MAFRFVHLGVAARVQVNALLPKLVGRDGITIGRTIYLAGGQSTITGYLLAHEFAHVLQWKRKGVFGFLTAYVGGLLKHGYNTEAHPMEYEAHTYGLAFASVFEGWARSMRGGR